jgi:type IV pilus assembly protein PilX
MSPVSSSPLVERGHQGGAALIVALLMLIAVLILGISAANIALQGEKASRGDRDRQVALQAAEAGLMDAELDIEGGPDKGNSRSSIFGPERVEGFAPGCVAISKIYVGLCTWAEEGATPAWQVMDFQDMSAAAKTVSYGDFTGQVFQTGKGSLPARPPRYIIELMPYNMVGESAGPDSLTYFYRVTAVGFGMRDTTQVMLQTFYRKDGK